MILQKTFTVNLRKGGSELSTRPLVRNAKVNVLKKIEEYLTQTQDHYISVGSRKLEFKENLMKTLDRFFKILSYLQLYLQAFVLDADSG